MATVSEDCAGRHQCEPPYPDSMTLESRWACPECRRRYRAYDVHAETPESLAFTLSHVPAGTIGWTTRDADWREEWRP